MILRTTAPDVSPMVPPAQVWSTHYRGSSRIDRTLWRSRPPMIAHIWRGAVRREDGEAYAEYMQATGIAGYTRTPGNRAALMLRRDVADRYEFVVFTLWDSMDAVTAFAGTEPEKAVFYPEDDRLLIDRDLTVDHYEVHTASASTPARRRRDAG